MSHGSTDFNQEKKSNSRSRHRNQHRRSQHRRHEEIKHQAQAPSPSPSHHHHHQSQSQPRNQPHTHSHSKPKSTNRKEENNRGSLTRSKSVSSSTTFSCTKSFATSSSSSTNHHLFNSSHTSIPTAKSRTVEYSANSSAAGWELRPHIPLVLALTSCGIILLLMVAGLTFVMLWRRRTFKLERKRLSRERRVREDGRREGLEMRLEGLGIELEDHHQEGENSISFEGRDKDGNLVEGMAIKESNSDSSINDSNNWKDSNSYEKKPITPMLNENWNQESLLGSSRIPSPKAAFISSVHHHQSSNKTNGGMVGGGSWRTLIPRKGKGGNGNDFQGTIEQYVYTPEITIESSNGKDMWSSFNTGTAEKNDGFGLGIGMRSQTSTPGGSPIADGWGGFLKRSRSPIQNQNQNPTSPSSTLNQQSQPEGSTFSSITVHQHERFGKAFDQMDLALDLAPAYSDAYAAAAPSRRFLESPSQVNTKDSTSRIGRFSFGLGAATMAAGLTRKLSRKLDVRKSMKFFSNSNPNKIQPPYQVHQNQIIIPGPITYQLNDTPALGELEFVTAPLASPGMSNPFDSAFARPNSPLDQQHRSTSPLVQSHLRPALDRFDSGASTLVPSRASQPSSSLGRKQSSRTTVIDESEEREEEEDEIEVEERNGEEEVEALNLRLSSSTIEKGLLWRTLPGGALRDGEPLGVAKDDQLMAISASSSEASLLVRRESNQTRGLRNQESSADQIVFTGPSANSRISNLESSSIGLGISMEQVGHSNSEDVVEKVYRSVQQLVREGLGTPRKRNRAVSDARSIGFPMDTSIDPDFSIGAITIRSRSATMESTRSTHFQKEKGRKRSGTVDSIHSTLTRRRANSEGRRRTLVTDEIDKFYPGGATKLSRQNRSRKSSGASSLAVPSRVSMGNRSIRNGENQDKHLSSASTASVWSRDSRPSSYVPIFNNQETRDSIQPPPVPEKDRISPQLNEASTALRNFFDSPSQGKRRKLEDPINTSSPQPQSRFSPFETPSIESPKVFTSSAFASIEPSLPAFPSSATISPRINYPQPKPNSKGLVHPVELQMRLEDAREEILGNGKGGQSFYPSTSSYTPGLSSSTKVFSSRLSTSKGDRTLIKSLVATHQTSVSTPEEYDSSYCGNASADTWSTFAGDDSIVSMEINNKASGSNTVRVSSALDPRRSGSFVSKTTTRHRSSHASQTPIVTVTEAFEPVNEEISNSSVYSNSESAQSSTPMKLLSSSPKSPSSLHRSRTTSGDSRRSRENSFGDDVSKSPRTRPRGATIPAPRAALRGARAAAAALAAASGLQTESGSISDIKVESPRIGSPRVAFAPLVEPSSSRPSSPRVAFADECNSISSSVSNSPQEKKSISKFESPMCSSPLRKNSNPPPHSSTSNISEKKDSKNRSVKSMSSSKRRAPSNLRIDTSARKPQIQRSNTTSSNEFDTSEEIVTPILVGSDNSTSSDSLEDESFSPTSTISIRSSFIPLSIASTESRSRDLISHRIQLDGTVEVEELKNDGSINSKSNSLLSANLSDSLTSLKRGRPITPRTSDYASPTMLVFRFYESEMEER